MCPGKREISSHITLEPRRAETYWHLTWTRARLTNFIGWHTCTSGGNINETHTASLGSHTALTRLWPWPHIQYCPLWTTMWWLEAKFYILWQRQTSQRVTCGLKGWTKSPTWCTETLKGLFMQNVLSLALLRPLVMWLFSVTSPLQAGTSQIRI